MACRGGIVVLCLGMMLWLPHAHAAVEDDVYRGDGGLYPRPTPVQAVDRARKIERDELAMAFRAFPQAVQGVGNEGVRVRITGVGTIEKDADEVILAVSTEWKNIHPKEKIERSRLENGADRTMGVGGLLGGGKSALGDEAGYVWKDVAYKVPAWGMHVVLLADGVACPLDERSAGLADGAEPSGGMTLARQGQARIVRFAFRVPAEARHLAFRFFDYANGHITLPLRGDVVQAGVPAAEPAEMKRTGRFAVFVHHSRDVAGYQAAAAPGGWRIHELLLLGRSLSGNSGQGDIVRIPRGGAWLQDSDGFVYAPLPAPGEFLYFFPEYPTRQRTVYMLPDGVSAARLLLRAGSQTLVLTLPGGEPFSPSPAAVSWQDGNTARFSLLGSIRRDGLLVLDLLAESLAKGKGVELSPFQQFHLSASGKMTAPDPDKTAALAHGAGRTLVLPPGASVRFLLAFPDTQAKLHFRGFESEHDISLGNAAGKIAADHLVPVARLSTPAAPFVATSRPAPASRSDPTASGAGAQSVRQRQPRVPKPKKAMPETVVAPLQLDGVDVAQEQEPNDSPDEAMVVRGDGQRVIRASIQRKDKDVFVLETDRPQLWEVAAFGEAPRKLILAAADGTTTSRYLRDKGQPLGFRGLYLLPGRHVFRVESSADEVRDYHIRFTPKGAPDPNMEREPNDGQFQAQRIRLGHEVHGLVGRGDDDEFRFSLAVPADLRLTLWKENGGTGSIEGEIRGNGFRKLSVEIRGDKRADVQKQVALMPGDYDLQIEGEGAYRFMVEALPPASGDVAEPVAGVRLRFLDAEDPWAAFVDQGQRRTVNAEVVNGSDAPLDLSLDAWFSQPGWQARLESPNVRLDPGQRLSVPVSVTAPADIASGEPIDLWLLVRDADGRGVLARHRMRAACGARPTGEFGYWPVPEPMLGGLNLASSQMGGRLTDQGKGEQYERFSRPTLFDGFARSGWVWRAQDPKETPEVIVELAGGGKASVTGVLLNPMGCRYNMPRQFDVALSDDGKTFDTVLDGTLEKRSVEQAFPLASPRRARYARLRVLSSYGRGKTVCMGEWKVVADPGFSPWHGQGANIADVALGGHLVWAEPFFTWERMLSKAGQAYSPVTLRPDKEAGGINWVVGFQHDRAARIAALEWKNASRKYSSDHPIRRVRVSVSTASPLGPWRDLGEWEIQADKTSRFDLEQPAWARFVRFSANGLAPEDSYALPVRLRIFEQAHATGGYRSILAEWGHYGQRSYYEFSRADRAAGEANVVRAGQGTRNQPVLLAPEHPQSGEVRFGADEDWYRVDVGDKQNALNLTLESPEIFKLRAELFDAHGKPVPWRQEETGGQEKRLRASVIPGSYLLHIAEMPRQVAIVWDQSDSVHSFIPGIYRALALFSNSITPGAEYANFLPFQDNDIKFLLSEWSDQPLHLLRALNDYDRRAGSSRAESNLTRAAQELGKRQGGRAVILITDASSGEQSSGNTALWKALRESRPRIFSIDLHVGSRNAVAGQQDRMQDWAMANGGHYAFFRTQHDLDTALDRAICKLRRPAGYVVSVGLEKLEPGRIKVARSKRSAAGAIELILDASGSMYKKLPNGKTRIAVAKSVMGDLVQHVIPPKTPVALRVYGHRKPRSCRTDLEVRLSPLDRERMKAIILRIDPKNRSKTPLAASIGKVADDLKGAKGKKLVLLVTDGKESCDGDPAQAIRALKEKGIDVNLNIVGFAIKDKALKESFAEWARLGGGSYFNAASEEELSAAVKDAISPRFEVLDDKGEVVARGLAGGDSVSVAPGTFALRLLAEPPVTMDTVMVEPGKTTVIQGW